ncbi:DUF1145 domain-containing protein [Candidatus Profftia tarda]|uniref:Uncharacterized protein YhhL n=1 Tax=Candidatus Profftia tarda TaxID=1177216 RepID=A0A8E4F0Z5_9ENTR|nr:DUF1145 domain-containing protein [Candidatus Profftia tarda]CAD6512642.1 Uncharacterized protein YhhL [Candidatus Profftia tarda]
MRINLGRLLMSVLWGFMLFNTFHPYVRPLNIFMNIALFFMIFMHVLQIMLLKALFMQDNPKISKWQTVRIFLFGVFELLD